MSPEPVAVPKPPLSPRPCSAPEAQATRGGSHSEGTDRAERSKALCPNARQLQTPSLRDLGAPRRLFRKLQRLNSSASLRLLVSTTFPRERCPSVWRQQVVKIHSDTSKVLEAMRQRWGAPSFFRDPRETKNVQG